MPYQALKELINPTPDGSLVLTDSDFSGDGIQGDGIRQLLKSFFEEAQLDLTEATVTADDGTEEISLKGQLNNSFLGIFSLEKKLNLEATFAYLGEEAEAEARVVIQLTFIDDWSLTKALAEDGFSVLSGDLTSSVRNQFDFPITSFVLDSALFSLEIGIAPGLSLNLNEASQYLQGLSVVDQFPSSGFPSFETSLAISSFKIGTRVDPMVLTYLDMELSLTSGGIWEPVGDLIRFKELKAEILLVNPLATPAAVVTVSAITEVSGGGIVASIELPSLNFECYLEAGNEIDIAALVAEIVDIPVPLPEIRCTAFNIVGDPSNSSYEFSATIETTWEILPKLVLDQLSANFLLITGKPPSTSGGFSGLISFGRTQFFVSASNQPEATGWQFRGGIAPDNSLNVADFVDDLISVFDPSSQDSVAEVKEILGDLEITQLEVSFHSQTKDFSFVCLMEFALDDQPSTLQLNIQLINMLGGHSISFDGLLTVGIRQFTLSFTSTKEGANSTTSLLAGFTNPEGEEIDLVTDLVNQISSGSPLVFSDSKLNLTTLILYELQLTYNRQNTGTATTKTYGIKGKFGWEPSLNLSGETIDLFKVNALVDLRKETSTAGTQTSVTGTEISSTGTATNKPGTTSKVSGMIQGDIQSPIEDLEFLSLGIRYELNKPKSKPTDPDDVLTLRLTIGKVTFNATYLNTAGDVDLTFTVDVQGALRLGDIVTFIASLVDPSIDSFEFDPPWDFITAYDLAPLLNSLEIRVKLIRNPKKKEIGVKITQLTGLVPSSLNPILTINSLELTYTSEVPATGGKATTGTLLKFDGSLIGGSIPAWDPINEAPPEIPGQGASMFELRYLGMGQHVAFTQAGQVNSIKAVMDLLKGAISDRETQLKGDRSLALRNPLETFGDGGVIAFSPTSEWLIGLDVSLLKTLNLTIIFNDPVIYGLRLELYGDLAKNFAGLQFEILYQRISDTIGKYHVDLTLPDSFRYFQVGAVSVTLPLVVIDIFTNSDFKVDLGFPWDFKFARSFAIEVFPFTGAGGFYFNKLSAATGTVTPTLPPGKQIKPADQGVFTPIYEFGLGLRIGLGKSFQAGPLKAEIAITVQGMVTGVLSWYNPIEPTGSRELYYKIGGGVSIVGRLYGEVDFGIISVSIEVIAKAMILFLVEVYQPIQILLVAQVSVKASIKVAFITISFSFGLTVEQGFTIPSPQSGPAPWLIG